MLYFILSMYFKWKSKISNNFSRLFYHSFVTSQIVVADLNNIHNNAVNTIKTHTKGKDAEMMVG